MDERVRLTVVRGLAAIPYTDPAAKGAKAEWTEVETSLAARRCVREADPRPRTTAPHRRA